MAEERSKEDNQANNSGDGRIDWFGFENRVRQLLQRLVEPTGRLEEGVRRDKRGIRGRY
ncbi:unnamed protein product [Moneuplotes crassus]|uniref:Uncharacterized protein n=1 Tax=Euplotes crassus TaxID=5936 RepID=A0AAD1UPJ3_EUPCR|nr:unnamed protein product [Moneuplotes crassus]